MDTHRYSRRTFATFSKKKKNTIENSRTKEYVNKLQQPIVGRDIMEVFFSMYPLFTDMSNVASELAEWPHRPWNRLRPSLAENRVESTNRIRYYFGSRLMWMFERKFDWFYNWDSELYVVWLRSVFWLEIIAWNCVLLCFACWCGKKFYCSL